MPEGAAIDDSDHNWSTTFADSPTCIARAQNPISLHTSHYLCLHGQPYLPASSTCFQPSVRVPHWTKDATTAAAPFFSHRKDATKQHAIRLLEDATPTGHSSLNE